MNINLKELKEFGFKRKFSNHGFWQRFDWKIKNFYDNNGNNNAQEQWPQYS